MKTDTIAAIATALSPSGIGIIRISGDEAIETADNKYKEMTDDVDYMKEYSYNLNKVYILLGELKNVINTEELELTKMKYINFIEKIS